MLSTDREQFDGQMIRLCASFDKPVAEKGDAYWSALEKMSLPEFVRVVDYAISEQGPDKIPITKQCWLILRKLKDDAKRKATPVFEPSNKRLADNIYFFANRVLMMHMRTRGGLGSSSEFRTGYGLVNCESSDELHACLKIKRELVREWIGFIADRDDAATPQQFIHEFTRRIDKVSPLSPLFASALASAQDLHASDAPFDESFAEIPSEWLHKAGLL